MAARRIAARPGGDADVELAALRARLGDRFEVIARLGVGGMGAVYEVLDRKRDERVALKTLHELLPESLYRFKHEFRGLADLSHANLAALFELFASDDGWYFTMELVRGISLLEWVRPPPPAASSRPLLPSRARLVRAELAPPSEEITAIVTPFDPFFGTEAPVPSSRSMAAPKTYDEPRLRHAFSGLANGLAALHAGERVHRDVKPSNVMVTAEGRVVILDFGIMGDLGAAAGLDDRIVGTPSYMAPEQSRSGARPSPANDWYSFGVVLYEALCGRRPFLGKSGSEIIEAKRAVAPPRVKAIAPHAPRDLASLCDDLLAREPIERPGEAEILARLSGKSTVTMTRRDLRPNLNVEVIGRREPLVALRASLARARSGHAELVLLRGRAGMGKTKLLDAFLAELDKRSDVLVLRGRVYERESVPFKALDDLVDALGRHLATRSVADLMKLLPPEPRALTEAFPVLLRVRSIAGIVAGGGSRPREVTRGALRALRHILVGLAAEMPLVMAVDDLHWGDADSAPLFAELAAEDRAPLLFIATFRSEHHDRSPLLQMISRGARADGTARVEDLELAALPQIEIERLVRELLGPSVPQSLARHIAVEANGSPQFALELARYARTTGDLSARTTLEGVIRQRTTDLSIDARRLLEVIATGGGPLPVRVLERATQLGERRGKVLAELVSASFVERSGSAGEERYDTMHEAVRQAVLGELPQERRRMLHLELAQALESFAGEDRDLHRLAHHLFEAWPIGGDAPKVFAMCLAAGRAAVASYAQGPAYTHLRRAQQVAEASQIPLDVAFQRLLGDAAARAGHVEAAVAAFETALAGTSSCVERAELHALLAKIYIAQMALVPANRALERALGELGERTTRPNLLDVLFTLGALISGWAAIRFGKAVVLTDDERRRLRVLAMIRLTSGYSAFYGMSLLGQLQALARLLPVARVVGAAPETAVAAAIASTVAMAAKRSKLARRLERAAQRMSLELDDPLATARVEQCQGHTANFAGDVLAAKDYLARCLRTRGPYLESVDYLTATADLAGNLMLRGFAREGLRWVELGLERVAVDDAGSKLAVGHTYYCYSATLLAMLGRAEEGRRRLESFGASLDPGQRWRTASWQAHRALFAVEVGDHGATFEAAIEGFRAIVASPRRCPLQMCHFYLAQACGHLAQLDGSALAEKRWRRARKELALAAGDHPTFRAHLLTLEAAYLEREGDSAAAEALRMTAATLARAHDNPLATWEITAQRIAAATRAGDRGRARDLLAEGEALAQREGWAPRLARLRTTYRV